MSNLKQHLQVLKNIPKALASSPHMPSMAHEPKKSRFGTTAHVAYYLLNDVTTELADYISPTWIQNAQEHKTRYQHRIASNFYSNQDLLLPDFKTYDNLADFLTTMLNEAENYFALQYSCFTQNSLSNNLKDPNVVRASHLAFAQNLLTTLEKEHMFSKINQNAGLQLAVDNINDLKDPFQQRYLHDIHKHFKLKR